MASEKSQQKLGLTWRNLTVKGVSSDTTVNENVFSLWNFKQQFKENRGPKQLKTILENCHGSLEPGQMLLVLGRPGSGCTTLLRLLSNRREGFAEIEGDVHFGSMHHSEAEKYAGQIVLNSEEETFFPTLTVGQTMDFVTRMKASAREDDPEAARVSHKKDLLETMGIPHTHSTKVGDAYVRGVSGGERKRVSIAECLALRGSVNCWDNSTRGLDASTALEFAKTLRETTDELGLTTVASFYQAGNGIFDLFDKVLVLDQGKQIFYGPREEALPFMNSLGFYCEPSANVADFLTGVTVPKERKIIEGSENKYPRTADEIVSAYNQTETKRSMEEGYEYHTQDSTKEQTEQFKSLVQSEKHKTLPKSSPFTTGFLTQLKTATTREFQVLWGDKPTLFIRQFTMLIQALISGSLFYMAPPTSNGLFVKGGAIFVAVLYPALMALGLTYDSFTGRPILAKHKRFALHHPAAYCLAQIVSDLPILLIMITHFSLVLYFLVGLKMSAGAFFIFWFALISVSMCTNAFFRFIGSAFPNFEAASKVSGFAVSIFAIYVGYQITKPQMHPWLKWLHYLNPLFWAFEAILGSEFHDSTIPCAGPNLVPSGPSYTDTAFQACTGIGGAPIGQASLTGDQYLSSLAFSHSHIWRNIGIIWAYWILYVGLTIFCTSRWRTVADASRSLLIPREKVGLVRSKQAKHDLESQSEEKGLDAKDKHETSSSSSSSTDEKLLVNTSVFTWKNLSYTVKTSEGDRVLLDNVYGYVKPGMLGALMGSSGAGKTTLMDVLAQRKTDGVIKGEVLVDGRPLSLSFQRSAGYCEQLDVHERLATVREALEFAALLRQPRTTPDEEKLRYVSTIIDLLELNDIEHTLIGKPGAGLSIEQQKRVTIGVELVSKPEILLFLDEPTSGLDGQAAFATVRFLRKLADAGQAVLVVIHQPSASLFAEFDTLLLLQYGGKMCYFGDIGDKAKTVKDYFARNGAPCPDETNPAEHMIDVVSGSLSKEKDWHAVWKDSKEHKEALQRLDDLVEEAASKPPATQDDGHEFAASQWTQTKVLSKRMRLSLFRDTDYVNNRLFLHIGSALFNAFTFWMVGDSVSDLQLRLFALFNFIFVAPGVFAQLQPLFLERRDIYETREKKSKTYSWISFCSSQIVSEIPYLLLSGVLYFAIFYFVVGFPLDGNKAGAVLFVMLCYEFLYTGIGQFVAAYAPNAVFASLVNPLIISVLVSFCGVLVPYSQITAVWRYTLVYVNPFTYLMGALLVFTTFSAKVVCKESELAIFDTPGSQTCAQYLSSYLKSSGSRTNLLNPDATSDCRVCQYRVGSDYLYTLNLKEYYYGWMYAGIVVLFCFSSYGMVYLLMKLRTKQTKKAEGS